MRAARLHGKEDIRIEEIQAPELQPGEVRVRIRAALTCGTDLKVYKRGYHAKMITPPAVFGHELAGEIVEAHPGAADWSPGARVVAANSAPCGACYFCRHEQENLCDDLLFLNGAYAESIVIPARVARANLVALRPETSFTDAALTEPLACVVQGIQDLALEGAEHVLIIGSGPIGLMFAALCRQLGCSVTLAGRGAARLALAARFGAETVEVLPEADLVGALRRPGKIFDVVVEATGKPEVWEAAVQLVRKGGKVNFFGGCPSGTSVRIDTGLIHYSNLTLLASFHHTPGAIRQALAWIERGVITARDFVTGVCPLEGLPALFRAMAQGNQAIKTLVIPG